jgi:hypothetical protein
MRRGLLVSLLLAACAGPDIPGDGAPVPAHETYLARPTTVKAETVRLLLPASYEAEISVTGLGDGWVGDGDLRVFEAAGDCVFRLRSLAVRCRILSVTLRPAGTAPEFILQAEGKVSFAHEVNGLVDAVDGAAFLLLRNDRRLTR